MANVPRESALPMRSRLAFSAIVAPARSADLNRNPAPSLAIGESVITSIQIVGLQRIEPETVYSSLKLHRGDTFDAEKLDQAVRDLFDTDLFADVTIRHDGSTLTIFLRENPIINRVVLEGNRHVKSESIFKILELAPHQIFKRAEVRADVGHIVEAYHRRGYLAVKAEPKMVSLDQGRVDIVYEIVEGAKTTSRSGKAKGEAPMPQKKLGREYKLTDGADVVVKRTDDRANSLAFFRDKFEITQREGSGPDRVILEVNLEGNPTSGLERDVGFSSLEQFLLTASVHQRRNGKALRAIVDVSTAVGPADSGRSPNQNSDFADDVSPPTVEAALESEIIATKVGIDSFLDRKSIEINSQPSGITDSKQRVGLEGIGDINVAELIELDYHLSFERLLVSIIYRSGVVNEIQNIISAERCLKFDDDITRRNVLARSLEEPLKPIFDEAGYPPSLRADFVDRIVDEILSYDAVGRAPWAARVVKDVSGKRLASPPPPLPDAAPAFWRDDKLPGEEPPQFVMRIYGSWIGNGLTMADVRKLDEPLAQSLYHHMRKGRPLPSGFDLPTKHEQRERSESAGEIEPDISRRQYLRQKQARYREGKRDRNASFQDR